MIDNSTQNLGLKVLLILHKKEWVSFLEHSQVAE